MSLPFKGQWKVLNGGIDKLNSHSWNVISQRYAYDFVKTENGGKRFKNDYGSATDYFALHQDILSPSDGAEKSKVELNLFDDLSNPLILSIINTLGIIVGGGFIYYTLIKLTFQIWQILIR